MKGEIIATAVLIAIWILESLFDNWLIHLLFILSWFFVIGLLIKFVWEVIKWHKKKKLKSRAGKSR